MLDPKEQAKGGFRAQAERQREHDEQIESAPSAEGAADAPDGTQPEGQADGARVVGPSQAEAPVARRPKLWH